MIRAWQFSLPSNIEAGKPKQKQGFAFICVIEMCAEVSDFQLHHQIVYHHPSRVWKANFTYSITQSQIKVPVFFLLLSLFK